MPAGFPGVTVGRENCFQGPDFLRLARDPEGPDPAVLPPKRGCLWEQGVLSVKHVLLESRTKLVSVANVDERRKMYFSILGFGPPRSGGVVV